MRAHMKHVIRWVTLALCLGILYVAWLEGNPWLAAGGAVGLCCLMLRLAYLTRASSVKDVETRPAATPQQAAVVSRKPIHPGDTGGLVEQMLQQGRFALLLRPKIVKNLDPVHLRPAQEALEQTMALVPDGEVVLGHVDEALDDGKLDEDEIAAAKGRVVRVGAFFLDRFPVTNQQFRQFVADGGYEQTALWDEAILPAVLDLVDQTGMPGPRYWRDGCFPRGEENHPVVGVSWYEASAYARWVGKRLPTDAEWVKAGSWPVPLSSATRLQRRYPWGDTMDRKRVNLWKAHSARAVPVDRFPDGVSVGGVYQLIGNVWEWTSGNFRAADDLSSDLELPTPMKNIRGGAFDTYFDNQATCQFQSGESPLGRRHNIGFRCVVGVCDLVLFRQGSPGEQQAEDDPAAQQPAPIIEEVCA